MAKDTLDSMADLVRTERQEGEIDEELRKRIIEIVKKKGGMDDDWVLRELQNR